ncbi:MAG TPA: hypothetical protein VK530_15850 [Candidatus Acidoferrum sp.]|nr:hypothetical protein [Candidatus Acidoferrum sp.]
MVTVTCAACVPATFLFSQNSFGVQDGPDGIVRTFTSGSVSVNITAFSRTKTAGSWETAFLGLYTGGLGVTDTSEGSGENEQHTTDNSGRDNYILFEFSRPVSLDKLALDHVVTDSDLRLWIGTFADPFNNHLPLNDTILASCGFTEVNPGGGSSATRTADVNVGGVVGNVIIVAALPGETNDKFKLQLLDLCIPGCVPGSNPPPVIICVPDKTVNCDQPWNFDAPSAAGGCGGIGITIVSTTTNANDCGFTATRTWRATDSCGSSVECNQTVSASCSACVPTTFKFSKDSNGVQDGPDGNIRKFSSGSVSVKISAFSRTKSSATWDTAFLGLYSGGLGVTDPSEGSGGSDQHTTDNSGRDNFILFEFSQPVALDRLYLEHIVTDSDLRLWVGTASDPFNNHLTLSDAVLSSLGFTEVNSGGSGSTRWADVNAGKFAGNVIVVAALPGDTNDKFKLQILDLCAVGCPAVGNTPPVSSIPAGWATKDIGTVGAAGSATYGANTFKVTGSGSDIWGTADEFRYLYVPSSGNCSIVARVKSVEDTDPGAKAGLLIRETLSPGAQEACVFLTPDNGVKFQYRSATGGTTTLKGNKVSSSAPYWLKLVRSGHTFTGYCSSNGSNWTTLGSHTFTVDSGAYIGIAVTSKEDGTLCEAVFDNITVSP